MCKTFIVAGTTTVRVFSFFIQEVPATHGNFCCCQTGRRISMEEERRKQEAEEAIAAANRVLMNLRQAETALSSAGSWGIWDMLGGGMFTTWIKHSRIDDARLALEESRRSLRSLRRELMDLEIPGDFKIDIGEFLNFADYFFDGLIIDWMVQTKIREASDNVKEAIRRVERLRTRLYEMLEADA